VTDLEVQGSCIVLGGGGHAHVLVDSLHAIGHRLIYGVLDPDPVLQTTMVLGVPVIGGDELLQSLKGRGVTWFVVGVGSVSNNRPRERLFEQALSHGLRPLSVVHPSAIVSPNAVVGDGCQILPGAIVNAGAKLGVNVIINSGAIVEHDCQIGAHAHVATGACLAANVQVGARSHIGVGAAVRQGINIGVGSVVGAGAAVVSEVPSGRTVVGVPARSLAG
jgi:sugar O-acyltransferase (sialic acid O-acetyltransferase NeuD family)